MILSALAVVTGCGPTCLSRCEEAPICQKAFPVTNCEVTCAASDAFVATSGCQQADDDLQGCYDDREDVCAFTGCDAEQEAYVSCRDAYCAGSPMAVGC